MSENLPYILNFSGSILAATLAAGQLVITGKKTSNYLYAFTFITISLWSGTEGLFHFFPSLFTPPVNIIIDIIARTAYSLTCVLLYFLMQSIFNSDFSFHRKDFFLFIPGISTLALLTISSLYFYLYYQQIRSAVLYILYIFSICIYLFIIFQINVIRKLAQNKKNRTIISKIMLSLAVAAILSIIPEITPLGIDDNYSIPFLIVVFYLITMRYPEIFNILREEAEKAHYARSKISNLDIQKTKNDIEHVLTAEKLFLESDLTLKELAQRAGITTHQLSEFLNVYYKKNFYDFINHYRIEEAKKFLAGDDGATALGICFKAGFNSNSAFYRAFKKETGISPGSYRKKFS
jgi:AraC-like DNA-binding protein